MERTHLLVTGDTGFIGSQLVPYLRKRMSGVVGLRERYPDCDLLTERAQDFILNEIRPRAILHLAWNASSTKGYRFLESQSLWTHSSLQLLVKAQERGIVIFPVGSVAEVLPSDNSAYGRSRQSLWQSLAPLVLSEQITWLRLHYVIDPVRRHPEIVAALLQAREPGQLPVMLRTPDASHDFICIRDVISAISITITGRVLGLVEIGSGVTHTVKELALALSAPFTESSASSKAGLSSPAANITGLVASGWEPRDTLELFK